MKEVLKNNIMVLLTSESVMQIENKIAEQKKCKIYKEDLPFLVNLIVEEVNQSEIPIKELEYFINNNQDKIIEFAFYFLDGQLPNSLSTGIAITYSIYLIYLKDKGDKSLEDYIKKRRIPNSLKFVAHLKKIKDKINHNLTLN